MFNKHARLIIAIDGPAGSGKSSTAKALAKRMGLPYIDTGAMYRAVTLKAVREGVSFEDVPALIKLSKKASIHFEGSSPEKQKVFLDKKDVTEAIRHPELTKNVFHVAQEPLIRREMVKKQKALGRKAGGVMEGRDIGTMVFPNADHKFYFEANPQIRAKRRHRELVQAGKNDTFETVAQDLKRRDETDFKREEGPLRKAKDAVLIDTSSLTIDETVDKILQVIESKSFPPKNAADPPRAGKTSPLRGRPTRRPRAVSRIP